MPEFNFNSDLSLSKLGKPNGFASLDTNGKIFANQLSLPTSNSNDLGMAYATVINDVPLSPFLAVNTVFSLNLGSAINGITLNPNGQSFVLSKISSYYIFLNLSIRSTNANIGGIIILNYYPHTPFLPRKTFKTGAANNPIDIHFSSIITTTTLNTNLAIQIVVNGSSGTVIRLNQPSESFFGTTSDIFIKEL